MQEIYSTSNIYDSVKLENISCVTLRGANSRNSVCTNNSFYFPPIPSRYDHFDLPTRFSLQPSHNLNIKVSVLRQPIKHDPLNAPYPSKSPKEVCSLRK